MVSVVSSTLCMKDNFLSHAWVHAIHLGFQSDGTRCLMSFNRGFFLFGTMSPRKEDTGPRTYSAILSRPLKGQFWPFRRRSCRRLGLSLRGRGLRGGWVRPWFTGPRTTSQPLFSPGLRSEPSQGLVDALEPSSVNWEDSSWVTRDPGKGRGFTISHLSDSEPTFHTGLCPKSQWRRSLIWWRPTAGSS